MRLAIAPTAHPLPSMNINDFIEIANQVSANDLVDLANQVTAKLNIARIEDVLSPPARYWYSWQVK